MVTLCLIILICFSVSCNSEEKDLANYNLNYLAKEFEKEKVLRAEVVRINEVLKPARLSLFNGALYVSCKGCDTMIYVYDTPKLNLIDRWGKKGQGPQEFMLFPVFCSNNTDTLSMWGSRDFSKIQQYEKSDGKKLRFIGELSLKENEPHNQLFLLSNEIAYYNKFPQKAAISKIDLKKNSKEKTLFIKFPEGDKVENEFLGDLCVSSKGIAYCYRFQDRIDFLDLDLNYLATVGSRQHNTVNRNKLNEQPIYYKAEYSGNKYLYAFYNEFSILSTQTKKILEVYEWSGKSIAKYNIDKTLDLFVVDEKSNILYGYSEENQDYFVVYQL